MTGDHKKAILDGLAQIKHDAAEQAAEALIYGESWRKFEMNDERRLVASKLGVTEEEYLAEAQKALRGFGMAPIKMEGGAYAVHVTNVAPSWWAQLGWRIKRAWNALWNRDTGW